MVKFCLGLDGVPFIAGLEIELDTAEETRPETVSEWRGGSPAFDLRDARITWDLGPELFAE